MGNGHSWRQQPEDMPKRKLGSRRKKTALAALKAIIGASRGLWTR
jgi:hypothetical protein